MFVGPNVRVTYDGSPANDRSESSVAVNPRGSNHLVGASKKFTDPADYAFTLAAYASFDGGATWQEAPPLALAAGWGGMSDPTVAFDGQGNAYVVALPFLPGTPPNDVGAIVGIAVYRSPDGINWSGPNLIHAGNDDKQDAAGDRSEASPHYGNVYVAWDSEAGLAFARTVDNGATWIGVGNQPVGTPLASGTFSPSIAVADDGTVYIVWIVGNQIKLVKSTDGGQSFTTPAVIVDGLTPLGGPLPGGTFRVVTIPTACAGKGGTLVVAWADDREGPSRIYCRQSGDGGYSWTGPSSGQALLANEIASSPSLHDFHPQLASDPYGVIGCAFYEFGPMPTQNLINTIAAFSGDNGQTFDARVTVTDRPWDPAVDAPRLHGSPTETFIGDYFGNAASERGFFPFWTDTRTGVQEIFTATVRPEVASPPFSQDTPIAVVARNPNHLDLFGVGEDGGVWSTWWDQSTNAWNDWYPIGRP